MAAIRVLIADDIPQVRQSLRTLLSLACSLEAGHSIEIAGEASNGLEALRMAEDMQPDVVLMDLVMPVMDGFEAARQIKSRCPGCRLIALTVHDYESARLKASLAGFDAYAVKGTPVETIIRLIFEIQE